MLTAAVQWMEANSWKTCGLLLVVEVLALMLFLRSEARR